MSMLDKPHGRPVELGFLRHFLAQHVPLLDPRTRNCLQAAVILACRCSLCLGSGKHPGTGPSVYSCSACGGSGRTWPTPGLVLDPREVEDLAQTIPPMDKEIDSAITRVDRAIAAAIQRAP